MQGLIAVLLGLIVLQGTVYAVCEVGDCQNGSGKSKDKDGGVYVGQFQSGSPHGAGMLINPDGSAYKGQFLKEPW